MRTARLRSGAISFRGFAALTTGLTLGLVMLGVYTAATGSGLACSAQWPLCDGGLLPQTIPSFIEWFHRLVAMITGFFILGTALWSWRTDVSVRTRLAATLAAVLLPLQISIGAVTVTLNGLLRSGYSPPSQGAHLVVALGIFTSLVMTTLGADASRPPGRTVEHLRRARSALTAALGALAASFVFSRVDGLLAYDPAAQAAFVGASLVTFSALVASATWLGGVAPASRRLAGGALVSLFTVMLLGRDLVYYTPAVRTVNAAVFGLTAVLTAAALWLVHRRDPDPDRTRGVLGD